MMPSTMSHPPEDIKTVCGDAVHGVFEGGELDPERVRRAAKRLKIHTDAATRALYATDASIYHCPPAGVFFPRDESDLVRAVEVCGEAGVPLLPRGSGTSLSGQALTSGIIVDVSRFRSVRVETDRAFVSPGVVIDDLDRAAAPHGFRWGPAPASSNRATIGGLLANNGTGAHSVVFGMASDHLLAARLLLADGSMRTFCRGDLSFAGDLSGGARDRGDAQEGGSLEAVAPLAVALRGTGPRGADPHDTDSLTREVLGAIRPVLDSTRWPQTWRNASGLDLRGVWKRQSLLPLFCGSEGRLGILLDAEVGLVPLPAYTRLAVFTYDDLVTAMRAVPSLLALKPSAIELMDRQLLALARQSAHFRLRLITGEPAAILMVEFEGETAADVDACAEEARGIGARMILSDAADQREIWATRREGLGLLMSRRARRRPLPFIEDCAVPVEKLPEYVERLGAILARHGTEGAYYAHASAGCLHIRPLIDLRDSQDRARMDAIMGETAALVAEFGGTLSGEHGDGFSKTPHLETIFGREIVAAFEAVRRAFDPHGLFRVPAKAALRVDRPHRRAPSMLARPDGFAGAVERCNGEATCRKRDGVMCPSFQATRDEALSTRGRANLLSAWMYGAPVEKTLDASLKQCLGCKACDAECPSNVDMSGLKAEYLYARRSVRGAFDVGAMAADRFFASYADLASLGRRVGIPFPGLVKRLFGIHPNASMAAPVRDGFLVRWRREARAWGMDPDAKPENADAILFVDTHMEYFEPEIGMAALKLCASLGLKVVPLRPGCCQRPAFSRGMLDKARRGLETLHVPGVNPVLVVEPSCLSMLRDDAPRLAPTLSGLARRVIGIEEFLSPYASKLRLRRDESPIVLHSHCHQKAMHQEDAARRLLEAVGVVTTLDSGCCGMAGSFGYDAATYDLSLAIAEERFLPGLRKAKGVSIVLTGRSCREMAARHGIATRHPLELLADRLKIKNDQSLGVEPHSDRQ